MKESKEMRQLIALQKKVQHLHFLVLKEELRKWEEIEKSSYWRATPGQRQAKRFINHSQNRAKELLSLSKPELKLITGFLTGHGPLRYHLKKMGLAETDTCRFCNNATETAEHILCSCEVLVRQRLNHLEQVYLTPAEVEKSTARKIVGFIRSLGLEDQN